MTEKLIVLKKDVILQTGMCNFFITVLGHILLSSRISEMSSVLRSTALLGRISLTLHMECSYSFNLEVYTLTKTDLRTATN